MWFCCECRSLGKRAREKVETEFSLDVIAKQYIELYAEILGKQKEA